MENPQEIDALQLEHQAEREVFLTLDAVAMANIQPARPGYHEADFDAHMQREWIGYGGIGVCRDDAPLHCSLILGELPLVRKTQHRRTGRVAHHLEIEVICDRVGGEHPPETLGDILEIDSGDRHAELRFGPVPTALVRASARIAR